jgi:hypothetical protein
MGFATTADTYTRTHPLAAPWMPIVKTGKKTNKTGKISRVVLKAAKVSRHRRSGHARHARDSVVRCFDSLVAIGPLTAHSALSLWTRSRV